MMTKDPSCPCGSLENYDACCEPYHRGAAQPETAEALMRSRYAAYVKGEIDYLVASTHPSMHRRELRTDYGESHTNLEWIGLEVLEVRQGGPKDKTGKVEFKAAYRQQGEIAEHHELSRFRRHAGKWTYLDGEIFERS